MALRVHRAAIPQREPAANNPVDEPESDEDERQPRDKQAETSMTKMKSTHSRDPQQAEPEHPGICHRKCDSSQVPRTSLRFT